MDQVVPLTMLQQQMNQLVQKLPQHTHNIIGGDFNIDFKENPEKNAPHLPDSYQQLIREPTTSYRSLLDHIYLQAAHETRNNVSGVAPTFYSNHDPV